MKVKTVGKKTKVWIPYMEFVKMGSILPQVAPMVIGGSTEYTISEVPEDKIEHFKQLGFRFTTISSKGRGFKKW